MRGLLPETLLRVGPSAFEASFHLRRHPGREGTFRFWRGTDGLLRGEDCWIICVGKLLCQAAVCHAQERHPTQPGQHLQASWTESLGFALEVDSRSSP